MTLQTVGQVQLDLITNDSITTQATIGAHLHMPIDDRRARPTSSLIDPPQQKTTFRQAEKKTVGPLMGGAHVTHQNHSPPASSSCAR
jgi:hypothetical protein